MVSFWGGFIPAKRKRMRKDYKGGRREGDRKEEDGVGVLYVLCMGGYPSLRRVMLNEAGCLLATVALL